MPPLPHNDSPDLDEERKKELIMEKKLRACRVNIIQRVRYPLDCYRGEGMCSPLAVFISSMPVQILVAIVSSTMPCSSCHMHPPAAMK